MWIHCQLLSLFIRYIIFVKKCPVASLLIKPAIFRYVKLNCIFTWVDLGFKALLDLDPIFWYSRSDQIFNIILLYRYSFYKLFQILNIHSGFLRFSRLQMIVLFLIRCKCLESNVPSSSRIWNRAPADILNGPIWSEIQFENYIYVLC